jgi:hypothetical protein
MLPSAPLVRRHRWQGAQCTPIASRSLVHWDLSDSVLAGSPPRSQPDSWAANAVITTIDHPLERPATSLNRGLLLQDFANPATPGLGARPFGYPRGVPKAATRNR